MLTKLVAILLVPLFALGAPVDTDKVHIDGNKQTGGGLCDPLIDHSGCNS